MMTPDRAPRLGLDAVHHIRVPRAVVSDVHDQLRAAGRHHREAVGFWAGVQENAVFHVHAGYVPKQLAGEMDGGSLVMVDGDELFRMNVWLHEHRLTLIAQVHSHPADAYHSDTDEEYPVMSRVGGLSIVVPDYAGADFDLVSAAVYRLGRERDWRALSVEDTIALIEIVEGTR
jgi:hypothetical protein